MNNPYFKQNVGRAAKVLLEIVMAVMAIGTAWCYFLAAMMPTPIATDDFNRIMAQEGIIHTEQMETTYSNICGDRSPSKNSQFKGIKNGQIVHGVLCENVLYHTYKTKYF